MRSVLYNVTIKKVSKAYPGTARNIGIQLAKGKYIAFFDVNTFPDKTWLEKSYNLIKKLNLDFLIGTRITLSNSYLKRINKFSTYGDSAYIAVTGTIILKNYLLKKNLFFLDTRAGEDIDWITRLTNKKKYKTNDNNIYYNGLSGNIFFNLKKWFTYSLAYAKIPKDYPLRPIESNQALIWDYFVRSQRPASEYISTISSLNLTQDNHK